MSSGRKSSRTLRKKLQGKKKQKGEKREQKLRGKVKFTKKKLFVGTLKKFLGV